MVEKRINKIGQDMSIGTLILIVLGIIVLVLLVLGFSIGWENLFSKIGIFQGSDLSSMVTACKVAAASDSKTSFCECKSVKIDGAPSKINCGDSKVISDNTDLKTKATQYACASCPA